MDILKHKFLLTFIGVLLVGASYFFLSPSSGTISQPELIAWMEHGYSNQFCRAIYPHIANCVSLKPGDCIFEARRQIELCVNNIQADLPDRSTGVEAKQTYESLAGCFQEQMHKDLLHNYLIKTEECQQLMS